MSGKTIAGRGENTGPNGENRLERTLRGEMSVQLKGKLKGMRRKMIKHGVEGIGKASQLRAWGPP